MAEAKQFARQDLPPVSTKSSFATMTLVDIYLAQGYRDRALEALGQMASREPNRRDIHLRIAELKTQDLSASPGTKDPTPPPVSRLDGLNPRPAERRTDEKKKFEEWINRIRQDGGPST